MGRNCRVALCTSSALSQQGTWVSLFFILLMKSRSTVSFCKSVWQWTPKQKGPSTSAFFNPLMRTAQVWSELAQRSILWLTEQYHTQLFAAKSWIVVLKVVSASPVTNATGQTHDTFQERTILLYLKNKQVWLTRKLKIRCCLQRNAGAENPKSYIFVSSTAFFTSYYYLNACKTPRQKKI